MLELVGTFGRRVVGIIGGRTVVGDVDRMLQKLSSVDKRHATVSQVFDASRIAGKGHLVHAARLALMAHSAGKGFASSLAVELACWTAGLRQIDKALERVGVRRGTRELAILTIGDSQEQVGKAQSDLIRELRIERDDSVVELSPKKARWLVKIFSLPKNLAEDIDVQKLLLERVALLSLEK
ncbi:MAG: KEOPS complex subunit Cgi121 [Hadesarchaea archaeon]|nr:KEOPS complex subunit Cgi121 [Hadesarchaea archaeon]